MLTILDLKKLSDKKIVDTIKIGLGQVKDVNTFTWRYAKDFMDVLVANNLGVVNFNYGVGKGKYKLSNKLDTIEKFSMRVLKFIRNYKIEIEPITEPVIEPVIETKRKSLRTEFYKSKLAALTGLEFKKFIKEIDKMKDGVSNATVDELIGKTFKAIDGNEFSKIEELIYSYIAGDTNLREIGKQLHMFGLLRNN